MAFGRPPMVPGDQQQGPVGTGGPLGAIKRALQKRNPQIVPPAPQAPAPSAIAPAGPQLPYGG